MIQTYDELIDVLDKKWVPLEPTVQGMRLLRASTPDHEITVLESELGIERFPPKFRSFIASYDVGNLTVGPVHFSFEKDYLDELRKYENARKTWDLSRSNLQLVMIATDHYHCIVLDCKSENILAFSNDSNVDSAKIVASDIDRLLFGLGTLCFTSEENKRRFYEVGRAAGAKDLEFWRMNAP